MWDLNNEEDEEEDEWPTPHAPESSDAPSAGMQAPSDPVATEGDEAGSVPDAMGEEAGYDVLADSDFEDQVEQVVEEEVAVTARVVVHTSSLSPVVSSSGRTVSSM